MEEALKFIGIMLALFVFSLGLQAIEPVLELAAMALGYAVLAFFVICLITTIVSFFIGLMPKRSAEDV